MNVMNIKHYLSAVAALGLLAACSEYDPGFSDKAVDLTDAEIQTLTEYTSNFVERYGDMDPNHTWGFGELAEMEEMGTRLSDPKSNMWITYTKENGIGVVDFQINGDIKIPGFPVENYYLSSSYNKEPEGDPTKPAQNVRDVTTNTPQNRKGWYHCRFPNEGNQDHWFENKAKLISYMQEHHFDEVIPVGDVAVCNDLSDAEVADVYKVFSEPWHGTNPTIDLKSYFVQQVWHGDAQYPYWSQSKRTDAANSGVDYKTLEPSGYVIGGEKMDYLVAKGEGWTAGDNEHFYNFNASNYSNNQGGMMLIYDSNTQNFAYFNSLQLGSSEVKTIWNHFRLVELHGNYYVGFDFESVMKDGTDYDKDIPRDHIYNDWIVKIIPGEGTIGEPDEHTRTIKRRLMCEDLCSTFDFDFNDLVFDVQYTREEKKVDGNWVPKNNDGKWDATITLQAVGGTLPIYIKNFDGTEHNAHELMGGTLSENGTYSPVNVGTGATHDPVTLDMVRVESTNPDNIVIRVKSPDKVERGADKVTTMILPSTSGRQSFGENLAPQKICMPVDVRWTKEYQQIEWAYPHFAEWVASENGAAGFGNEHDWTRTDVDETKLYK